MASIKDMLQANTADILEATELLKVLGDRDGQYVWKQLTAEGGDFVAFVTADDENSYPDGGTQDGYYYVKFDPLTAIAENIREGVDIWGVIGTMKKGASGIDFGEVTLTGIKSSITINHSLGVTPSQIYLIPKGSFTVNKSYLEDYIATTNYVFESIYIDSSSEGLKKFSVSHTRTSTSITFKANATFRPLTYYWIAIA